MPAWSHVRAALIAGALLANAIVALPFGPRVTPATLARPAARSEVAAWMGLFGPLGFTRTGFERFLIDASDRLVTVDETLNAPFRWFLGVTKTGQSWALFAVPDADPMRLTVVGTDAAGVERVLYRRLDPDHTFLRGPLDFRRVRGVYDLGSDKKGLPPRYTNLAHWVGDRALDAHPDLVRVRVFQVHTRTTLPGEPPDPTAEERFPLTFTRGPT